MARTLNLWRVVLLLFCVTTLHAGAQEPESRKSWQFHGKSGDVEITLISSPGSNGTRVASLHISSGAGVSRSVSEESKFLEEVLNALPKQGLDAHSLTMIGLRLNEKEARMRLAGSASKSPAWRSSVRTKNVAKVYPLIVSFLNASGAYKEWSDVFSKYGLALKVVGVEEVEMEGFSKLGMKCPSGANCTGLLVPSDALLQINVVPLAHQ